MRMRMLGAAALSIGPISRQTKGTIVVVDGAAHEVVATWAMAPGESAAGLLIGGIDGKWRP